MGNTLIMTGGWTGLTLGNASGKYGEDSDESE